MNTSNIIKKCLDELNKENFRKDYVLGMLETLYETQGIPTAPISPSPTYTPFPPPSFALTNFSQDTIDEGAQLDMEARAMMGKLDLSSIKVE